MTDPVTPATQDALQIVPLAQSAAQRIAAMIHDGELQPGDRLPAERKLATELGLSRPALREALRTLESVGLLEARVGSGRYVTMAGSENGSETLRVWMQLQPIGDVISVRRFLEPAAILNMPATQVAPTARQARDAAVRMRKAFNRGDFDAAVTAHTQFHQVLVQFAPSRLHRLLVGSLIESAEAAQLNLFRAGTPGRHSIDKHFHIVDALQDGDVQGTADRIVDHLEPAFSYLDPPHP